MIECPDFLDPFDLWVDVEFEESFLWKGIIFFPMFVLNTFGESNFDAVSIYVLGTNYIYATTDPSLLLVISVSYFWKSE